MSDITTEDLNNFVYDPNSIQRVILNNIENKSDGDVVVTDPTNPFTMLLEAASSTAYNGLTEAYSYIRRNNPNLAMTKDELYPHLTNEDTLNLFAIPSETYILFYVSILDLKQNGYRKDGKAYVETIIPEYTAVKVLNTTFTLMNDISVKLFDEGNVLVEQLVSDDVLANSNVGVVQSAIQSGTDTHPWIIFEVPVKQMERIVVSSSIISAEGYKEIVNTDKQYYSADVSIKNASTNNEYVSLPMLVSDEYVNPNLPCAFFKQSDAGLEFRIPDVFLLTNQVTGNARLSVYVTKGKTYLPLNKFSPSEYVITLGNTVKTPMSATSTTITMLASSRRVLNGGKDIASIEDIRNTVIDNTAGTLQLPITEKDISRVADFDGFEITKALDIITDRMFIASKNNNEIDNEKMATRADVFFNKTTLVLDSLKDNSFVFITENEFVIKSGTMFKEVNGIVTILSDLEVENIKLSSKQDKINLLKTAKYFFTPYYYTVDKLDTVLKSRVYNLDEPIMSNLKIVSKNLDILESVNTETYEISKTDLGYKIKFTLVTNAEFDKLHSDKIRGQLTLPLKGGRETMYIESTYDRVSKSIEFLIATNSYIDKDSYFKVENGVSNLNVKEVFLDVEAKLILYTIDSNIYNNSTYLLSEIDSPDFNNITAFNKELVTLNFGKEIEYIWKEVTNGYTNRMYKKHEVAIPAVYEEVVLGENLIENPETNELELEVLHHIGDPILDENGDPINKYEVGSVMLDENGLPIIDQDGGVVRYVDICMLELEYLLSDTVVYTNYLTLLKDLIKNMVLEKVPALNDKLLENTIVVYKSYKTSGVLEVTLNGSIRSIPYAVSPTVTLYSNRDDFTKEEYSIFRDTIGKIIHKHLDSVSISLQNIKDEILATVSSEILAVSISGLDTLGNLEAFTINDKLRRLVINKQLELTDTDELSVIYNLELDIIKT